jgi:hypothetical protein
MTSPDSRKTGATGIWTLEVNSGDIDLARSSTFTSLNWQGLLAVPVAFAGLKFLGEVVAGAFAGYAVKQLFPSDEQKDSNSIVLQFPANPDGSQPPPVNTGIKPGSFVTSARYLDSMGDLVDINLSGSGSFRMALAGGLTNLADALSLELKGTDSSTGLSVSVTPIQQSINAGSVTSTNGTTGQAAVSGLCNRMYSPGYTNLDRIFSRAKTGAIGDIELKAAIANSVNLAGHSIRSSAARSRPAPRWERSRPAQPEAWRSRVPCSRREMQTVTIWVAKATGRRAASPASMSMPLERPNSLL